MSDIQAVFAQLNDIEGTIASIERNAMPDAAFAQELALTSLRIRRAEYRAMVEELSSSRQIDVCDYRIVPDALGHFPAKAVSGVLGGFQDMFTAFFSSVRENRPRHKAIFDSDIVNASTLNMGYTYSGSLGLVLYVPSDQLLPAESDQDIAIHAIFELTKQKSSTGIRAIADRFGRTPVKRFYDWSKFHVSYGMSAEIKWKRGDQTKEEVFVQPEELRSVGGLIEEASDYTENTEVVSGILVALDVTRHSFKLSFPEAKDIHGLFDDKFDWKIPHEIPGRYRATVVKRTTSQLWSGVDTVSWTLVELEELS